MGWIRESLSRKDHHSKRCNKQAPCRNASTGGPCGFSIRQSDFPLLKLLLLVCSSSHKQNHFSGQSILSLAKMWFFQYETQWDFGKQKFLQRIYSHQCYSSRRTVLQYIRFCMYYTWLQISCQAVAWADALSFLRLQEIMWVRKGFTVHQSGTGPCHSSF